MKVIRYEMERTRTIEVDGETQTITTLQSITVGPMSDDLFDANYALAESRAVGEITVEEVEDEETEPTAFDRVEAQVTYTAMMTDTLLEV